MGLETYQRQVYLAEVVAVLITRQMSKHQEQAAR
jgi:hypothetical protein